MYLDTHLPWESLVDRIRGDIYFRADLKVTNEKIDAIFDLTYSSVSQNVKAVISRMVKEHKHKAYLRN